MTSRDNSGIIQKNEGTESKKEHPTEEQTGNILDRSSTESRTCETDIISLDDKDIHDSNKDVILKLIVPEMRMNLPSYIIGSIALVTSSLSNSGTLVLFYFHNMFITSFLDLRDLFQGLIRSCYICYLSLTLGVSAPQGLRKRIRYVFFQNPYSVLYR
jgi:hypothetical protein